MEQPATGGAKKRNISAKTPVPITASTVHKKNVSNAVVVPDYNAGILALVLVVLRLLSDSGKGVDRVVLPYRGVARDGYV